MNQSSELVLSVTDFVAVFNQTLEYAYPGVTIQGELANIRVSKNRWLYFDLKDEYSSVKFFGTVYQLPGPLEDGMLLQVSGQPRLHPLYGFSINVQSIRPVGEGSIKRAAALLQAKLLAEGLFDDNRKRPLPYPPERVGLITSRESAAYHDFIKILNERWGGVEVLLADVQVQGEASPEQIIAALEYFTTHDDPVDVIVITRGGGSPEDLAAFSTEQVTRAVAGSRIPTLVAVGHEVDVSLAELAADRRASTPSNAAQVLVPDKHNEIERLQSVGKSLFDYVFSSHETRVTSLENSITVLGQSINSVLERLQRDLIQNTRLLTALSPMAALNRGYTLVRMAGKAVNSVEQLNVGADISITFRDGEADASITSITK
jgi:exodeoxyribonuclease VII large subunit